MPELNITISENGERWVPEVGLWYRIQAARVGRKTYKGEESTYVQIKVVGADGTHGEYRLGVYDSPRSNSKLYNHCKGMGTDTDLWAGFYLRYLSYERGANGVKMEFSKTSPVSESNLDTNSSGPAKRTGKVKA